MPRSNHRSAEFIRNHRAKEKTRLKLWEEARERERLAACDAACREIARLAQLNSDCGDAHELRELLRRLLQIARSAYRGT